jgi:hypothetical protein
MNPNDKHGGEKRKQLIQIRSKHSRNSRIKVSQPHSWGVGAPELIPGAAGIVAKTFECSKLDSIFISV